MEKIKSINVATFLTMSFFLAGVCLASKNGGEVHVNTHNQEKLRFEKVFNIVGEPSFAIIQDKDGFIWSGSTSSGLIRYDGYDLKYFKAGKNSVSTNWVNDVFEDSEGCIWLGTQGGGLNKYDKKTGKFTWYKHKPGNKNSIADNTFSLSFSLILEDRDDPDILWLGTQGGLDKFHKKKEMFTHYSHIPGDGASLSSNEIMSIAQDKDGIIWIGTKNGGLNRFDRTTGRSIHYRHDPNNSGSLSDNWIWSLMADDDHILWIGTSKGGLNKFDIKTTEFTRYTHDAKNQNSIPKMEICFIKKNQAGNLLMGEAYGSGSGLVEFDRNTEVFTIHKNDPDDEDSLPENSISAVLEDRTGILWISFT